MCMVAGPQEAIGGVCLDILHLWTPLRTLLPVWFQELWAGAEPFASGRADAVGLEFPGEMQRGSEEFVSFWGLLLEAPCIERKAFS